MTNADGENEDWILDMLVSRESRMRIRRFFAPQYMYQLQLQSKFYCTTEDGILFDVWRKHS